MEQGARLAKHEVMSETVGAVVQAEMVAAVGPVIEAVVAAAEVMVVEVVAEQGTRVT
jgi:hypothetical protein